MKTKIKSCYVLDIKRNILLRKKSKSARKRNIMMYFKIDISFLADLALTHLDYYSILILIHNLKYASRILRSSILLP